MGALSCLYKFYKNYDGKKGIIGVSTQGRIIPYFLVEKTAFPTIIIQYSIHAREYITTYLALKQIKEFNKRASFGRVFFIPMLNPDGVNIATSISPLYKANARGVDLNVNFDAMWGKGKQNVFYKGSQNYVGPYPFSEIESVALRDFTLRVKPQMTISYHSKGEEIYFEFNQVKNYNRDKFLADIVASVTGYQVKRTVGSVGGYKDWCIQKLKIPALTIEVGNDKLSHPIKRCKLGKIYKQNANVVSSLIQGLDEICKKNL